MTNNPFESARPRRIRRTTPPEEIEPGTPLAIPCCECGRLIHLPMSNSLHKGSGAWWGIYCGDCGEKARKKGFTHGA